MPPSHVDRINGWTGETFSALLPEETVRRQEIMRAAAATLFADDFVPITLVGTENIPTDSACILAPNHPQSCRKFCVLADGHRAPPFYTIAVRHAMEQLGIDTRTILEDPEDSTMNQLAEDLWGITIKRANGHADAESLLAANHLIASHLDQGAGHAISVHPEGNTYGPDTIGPLQSGAFWWAREHQVPIVPTRLQGFDSPQGNEMTALTMTFGQPFPVEGVRVADRPLLEAWRAAKFAYSLNLREENQRPDPLLIES